MTIEELDQIHIDWDKKYLKLAEDFVRVDMELMKLKSLDPNRPRCSILGNVIYSSGETANE